MIAGFEHHLGRAEGCLRGELRGHVAGQAHLDAGLGKRLNDDVNVRRAGA